MGKAGRSARAPHNRWRDEDGWCWLPLPGKARARSPEAWEELSVAERRSAVPRPGRPSESTAEHTCHLVAMACEQPNDRPISHWTGRARADDVMRRGMVPRISARVCGWCMKTRHLRPQLLRSWLTSPADPQKEETIGAICQISRSDQARRTDWGPGTETHAPRIAFGSRESGAT
jgi:hypothetical protein